MWSDPPEMAAKVLVLRVVMFIGSYSNEYRNASKKYNGQQYSSIELRAS